MEMLPKFLFSKSITTDFTIHNLPYGVFRTGGSPRIGCAIGDKILDLKVLAEKKLLHPTLTAPTLNPFMATGKSVWKETRESIKKFLSDDAPESLSKRPELLSSAIVDQSAAEMVMPATIGDYTDFYASEHHAANVGRIFDQTKSRYCQTGSIYRWVTTGAQAQWSLVERTLSVPAVN